MPAPTNPLPQLSPARIRKAHQRVAALVVEANSPLKALAGPITDERVDLAVAKRQRLGPIAPNTFYGKQDGWQHRWFRIDVPKPSAAERGRRFLRFDCQGEHTAYLDGAPWAGYDCAHPSHLLPDRACTLWIDSGIWATGVWAPGHTPIGKHGARFDGCSIEIRDDQAWGALWDLDLLHQYVLWLWDRDQVAKGPGFGHGYHPPMEKASPLLRRVLAEVDDHLDAWDRSGGERAGLGILRKDLAGLLATIPAEAWQPIAALCGHAHIDLVWLWPEKATERKGIHTYATQLRLMERYREFVFVASQPALYRAIDRLEPVLGRQIRARIKTGQWEAMGGFEVEPDNQLPSGEALARSLVLGQAKTAELTGKPSRVCWIPDVFGYAACLPQILRLGGVDRFYTTKMTWSAVTRFPYTSFVWKGNDGSEVLTHLCSTGYNGDVSLKRGVIDPLEEHRQAGVHGELLLGTGYGDGGGGPTEAMLERARRLGALRNGGGIANVPRARWSRTDDFFDRLEACANRLPTYQGELYLEYHRGTFTTQSEFKRLYRHAETGLQTWEAARVLVGGKPVDEKPWQRVAFAQFHDAIPGSSITLVYQQMNPELARIGDDGLARAAKELAGKGRGLAVFNPLPQDRIVSVEAPYAAAWTADGAPVASQAVGSGKARRSLLRVPVKALATVALALVKSGSSPAVAVSSKHLDNGIVRVRFDAKGRLVGLTVRGEEVALSAPAQFRLYRDEPANYDAWDIDHQVSRCALPLGDPGALTVVEVGPARAVLRGRFAVGESSQAQVDYILEAGSDHLGVEVAVDWQETHRTLRYLVATDYVGPKARYGLPFGSIDRPQQPGTDREEAMWEVPGSRWAAVLDHAGERGLALLTEAKFGFSCRAGLLGLTLLRSSTHPDQVADKGSHRIRFAVGAYSAGDGSVASTAAAADAVYAPAPIISGGTARSAPFTLDARTSLVPSWVLPEADGKGYVIRFHETAGRSGTMAVTLNRPARKIDLVDFTGKVVGKVQRRGDTVRFAYAPFQVVSLRVR